VNINKKKLVDVFGKTSKWMEVSKKHCIIESGVNITSAVEILGKDKVIAAALSSMTLEFDLPNGIPLRYSAETLCRCAHENLYRVIDWRLVYLRGLSVAEQMVDPVFRDLFYEIEWLEKEKQIGLDVGSSWTDQVFPAGYYLINCAGLFKNCSWFKQEEIISKISNQVRCPEAILSEFLLTSLAVNNKNICCGENYYWSCSESNQSRSLFSDVDERNCLKIFNNKLKIYHAWSDMDKLGVETILLHEFDF